jgi:hypothetical protein
MKRKNWIVEDYSIRPAGEPDECFYCNTKKGSEHKKDCVIRRKTIILKAEVTMIVERPETWTGEEVENVYNEGSWCADSLIDMLKEQIKRTERCLCQDTKIKFVREATKADEENYKLYVEELES